MSERTGVSKEKIGSNISTRKIKEDIKYPQKTNNDYVSPDDVFETSPLKLYPNARRKLLKQRAKQKLKQKELRAKAEKMKYEIETEDGNPKDYDQDKS